MARKDSLPIPRSDLPQGSVMCIGVASLRRGEAEKLLAAGYSTAAGIVFSFAVEEFGKAVLLREGFLGGADPVTIKGFYDHRAKIAAAGTVILPEDLKLSAGAVQADFVQADAFDTGAAADFDARIAGLYIDWKDGTWLWGVEVDPPVLSKGLEAMHVALVKATAWNW